MDVPHRLYPAWPITEREALAVSYAIMQARIDQVKVASPVVLSKEFSTAQLSISQALQQAGSEGQAEDQPSRVKKKKKTWDEKMVCPADTTLTPTLAPLSQLHHTLQRQRSVQKQPV